MRRPRCYIIHWPRFERAIISIDIWPDRICLIRYTRWLCDLTNRQCAVFAILNRIDFFRVSITASTLSEPILLTKWISCLAYRQRVPWLSFADEQKNALHALN